MSSEPAFSLELEQVVDYQFAVRFGLEGVPDVLMDEPAPLGHGKGPNASRMLAAAVANCLCASLLFCLRKARQEPQGIAATVTTTMMRNEAGRLRIGGMHVVIDVKGIDDPAGRFARCTELFEDFCVVTASVRQGMTVAVTVNADGRTIHTSI